MWVIRLNGINTENSIFPEMIKVPGLADGLFFARISCEKNTT